MSFGKDLPVPLPLSIVGRTVPVPDQQNNGDIKVDTHALQTITHR